MAKKPNRTIRIYKSYSFVDKDPVIDELRTIKEKAGYTDQELSDMSGVHVNTLKNWFVGKTRRPQNDTTEAAGRAMGFRRSWVRIKN